MLEIFDRFGTSNHESKVNDIEDPENPVDEVLFNEVLKRYHGDEDDVNQSSHDKSLGSKPVVVRFPVVVFNLILAVINELENLLFVFEHLVDNI